MESADALAAKRRVLVDALMMCLGKSRVVSVVDARTIRGVLDSAAAELWREGEFRLEPVWKLLVNQPGLTAEDVAPPLLVFKAYEKELGVQVRVPQALSAIPRGEQVKLRDGLGITREDFATAIDAMHKVARAEQDARMAEAVAQQAAQQAQPEKKAPSTLRLQKVAPPKKPPKALAAILSLAALGAMGAGVYFGTRDTSQAFDVSDVAGTVQLANARRGAASLSATIADPKWDSLSKEDQKKLALQLLEQELPKGIHLITLSDDKGATRALISEGPTGHTAVIP
jgi:hypothetical protein